MLNLFGSGSMTCDGVRRRDFLKVGALGLGGLSLTDLLRLESHAGQQATKKSIINIYLAGGPTHMDTFDLKPEAPAEFRGEFHPIKTNAPGVEICELMPNLATMGDRFAIVRSLTGVNNEHRSTQSDSGWSAKSMENQGGRPGIGSVCSKLWGPANVTEAGTSPTAVDLTGWTRAGFLGNVHAAYRPDNIGKRNLQLDRNMSVDRFSQRNQLLASVDRVKREIDATGRMEAMDSFAQRAYGMITSGRIAKALDLNQEADEAKQRYETKKYRDNERFLMARRLIEADVRCVSLSIGGWDTHRNNFDAMKKRLPPLDIALSALLEDLAKTGRLDDTIVMMSGEFGRTPRINRTSGRDHWPKASFFFLAGGGLKTGQVVGATNRLGETPQDRPVHLQQVFATVYRQLGINPDLVQLTDNNGRPQYLLDHREPITELL